MAELIGYGKFIKQHREASGYKSQRQLAEATKISSATLSRIEAEIQKPNIDTLRILSDYLKTTTYADLMEKTGYFEGLSDKKKEGVSNFFTVHKSLDDALKISVTTIFDLGADATEKLMIVIKAELADELQDYLIESGSDEINPEASAVVDFLAFADSSMEVKANLNVQFDEIIKKHATSIHTGLNPSPSLSEPEFNPFDIFRLIDMYTDDEIIENFYHFYNDVELDEKTIRMHLSYVRFLKSQK